MYYEKCIIMTDKCPIDNYICLCIYNMCQYQYIHSLHIAIHQLKVKKSFQFSTLLTRFVASSTKLLHILYRHYVNYHDLNVY